MINQGDDSDKLVCKVARLVKNKSVVDLNYQSPIKERSKIKMHNSFLVLCLGGVDVH